MPVPTAAKDDAGAPRTPPPAGAAPPPALLPAQLSGRFAGIQGRTMHTWEFRPDGTFEHAWTASGGNAVVEAGTYSVMGPYLTLAVWGRAASASAPPARGHAAGQAAQARDARAGRRQRHHAGRPDAEAAGLIPSVLVLGVDPSAVVDDELGFVIGAGRFFPVGSVLGIADSNGRVLVGPSMKLVIHDFVLSAPIIWLTGVFGGGIIPAEVRFQPHDGLL